MSDDRRVIWFDGKLVASDDATVHVLAHALNHGTGVFEGLRAYRTEAGTAIFRLDDHLERLERSAAMLDMQLPFSHEEIRDAILNVVAKQRLNECYIRVLAFRGVGRLGLDPAQVPVSIAIAAWAQSPGFDPRALEHGIRLGVARWVRPDADMVPHGAKATGPYLTISLARSEAVRSGYDDALVLNRRGLVVEATIMNVFAIFGDRLVTPPAGDGPLLGITRATVMSLGARLGLLTEEASLTVPDLQRADAVLCTGTASEVVSVSAVLDEPVSSLTCASAIDLTSAYHDCVRGIGPNEAGWLALVPGRESVSIDA